MEWAALTNSLSKAHPNDRFAMSIGDGAPTLTGPRSRTHHLVSLPINSEAAVIKAGGRLGLPAQIWHHWTDDLHLITALTLRKHFRIDIATYPPDADQEASPGALTGHEVPP